MNRLGIELDPLLQRLEDSLEGPAVVAIGGGTGLAQTLLAARRYAGDLTAVVGVTDDGGSSGRLAPALGIPPPGDLRRCLVALTPEHSTLRDLFDYRFEAADVKDHSLGNLILAALADIEGDFEAALRVAEIHLGAAGQIVPVADQALQLAAVVAGREVIGQVRISETPGTVTALGVTPATAAANLRAIEAITAADQIVLGPGSLYTSTIAPLVVPGVADAVNESGAQLVYVCNLITQDAETLGMDGNQHVAAVVGLAGTRFPDAIVASDSPVRATPPLQPVRMDPTELDLNGADLVVEDLADSEAGWPAHDPTKLGNVLAGLAIA